MKYDWKPAAERVAATFAGETPDRVPFATVAHEDIAARISGLTIREMLMNPKRLAEVTIQINEFLGNDMIMSSAVPAYAGPLEGFAYARANGKVDKFVWKDYGTPFIREGSLCETEKDIEQLQIPDHLKVEPWPTMLKALAIIKEKTGIDPGFALSLTWSNVQMLRGAQAYIDVRKNPDLLLQLCEKIYASQWDLYQAYCKLCGNPLAVLNCQYAFNRHMLSFEDAWKFEGQFAVRFCKDTGIPLMIHNCGFDPYWDETIEKLREEGVAVIAVNGCHPLDLDEWVRFREKFPDIVIIGASLYVNGEIQNGTPEDVERRVRDNIVKLAPYKRFIVSPTCSLGWRMSLPNIMAVGEATKKYGRYPIDVTK